MADALDEMAARAVDEYMAGPAAAEKVAAVARKAVNDAIESALRRGSDFHKRVEAAVAKALAVHGDIDLPSYGDAILKIVARQVEHATRDAIERQVAERMKDLLTPAPEAIKLSEVIDQYREYLAERLRSGCVCHGDQRFAVRITEKDGFTTVCLDEEAEARARSDYQWDIRFGVYRDRIYHLAFQNADVDKQLFAGPFYAFQRSLFQMKAAQTRVELDVAEGDIDTRYGTED